ncbi:MAG: aconitate hydratase AcnA [Firmicutes bacterium]|nr:aconitate hydratase AcnA [Bacillota bacterium]
MAMRGKNTFGAADEFIVGGRTYGLYRLEALEKAGFTGIARLPVSLKVLLENLLRNEDDRFVHAADIEALARWTPESKPTKEIAFLPARILMQDFTGVPAIVDLAAMREAMKQMGGDPTRINPLLPTDLVIDHSIQVDKFGTPEAFALNEELEYLRNRERYVFLRWGQKAFANFRVVPPNTGICHQVNLEYLARVVQTRSSGEGLLAFPDTVLGLDSHTTMINGLGVVGWGVGGIEAEAAMLGQPYSMVIPEVVGFKLTGRLPEGSTATDLVLTITQMLRQKGVVGKFVEFYGPGLSNLSLPDRATISNMAPEYGATIGFFPVDEETLSYLRFTGRDEALVQLVEAYCKEQGLFRTDRTPDPLYSDTLELNLETVEPTLAGPRRPHDRVPLRQARQSFLSAFSGVPSVRVEVSNNGDRFELSHGAVVIAAITSCTNTSNPALMLGAGLLAQKAVERGLRTKPWVKTSLAPGSKVVTDYLQAAGLMDPLERLGFHLVAYGCTTCIGNSGPLHEPVGRAVKDHNLVAVAVLSGNRNFEGRINPLVRANYLASPPLVVAYALAGRMDLDLYNEPLGHDPAGRPVYLRDIWPSPQEVVQLIRSTVTRQMFQKEYRDVFTGGPLWGNLPVPEGDLYAWDERSTYIQLPPYFENMPPEPPPIEDIYRARVLVLLGDTVTTDHISPAGSIPPDSPAGRYLIERGVQPAEFNSYGARRGNHEVMLRGTFANIRLRNLLVPDTEGGWTVHLPSGEKLSIYDAAMRYQQEGVPLLVIAGKEYGAGSSRDWAAKGTRLLGIRAVLAESFERIHRSNLIGMGVLPLQFLPGESHQTLGLTGRERYDIVGLTQLEPRQRVQVVAHGDKHEIRFEVLVRLDTPVELTYYRHGGILNYVLRQMH